MRPKLMALLCMASLLTACRDEGVRPSGGLPLDSAVLIGLSERLPERSLVLECRTSREYPCANYRLDASLLEVPGTLQIRFKQVIPPEVCLTALGPARVVFETAPLRPGTLQLDLRSDSGSVTGQLGVSEAAYVVTVQPGPVAFPEPRLERIPAGTVWGYFGYAGTDLEPAVRAILAEMGALGGTTASLAEGRYSVVLANQQADAFRVDAAGALDYGGTLGYYHVLPFALAFTGDFGALRDLVADVEHKHGDAVHLRVCTSRGDAFMSWMLGRELQARRR